MKEKTDKLDNLNIKNLFSPKDIKWKATVGEDIGNAYNQKSFHNWTIFSKNSYKSLRKRKKKVSKRLKYVFQKKRIAKGQ